MPYSFSRVFSLSTPFLKFLFLPHQWPRRQCSHSNPSFIDDGYRLIWHVLRLDFYRHTLLTVWLYSALLQSEGCYGFYSSLYGLWNQMLDFDKDLSFSLWFNVNQKLWFYGKWKWKNNFEFDLLSKIRRSTFFGHIFVY